MGRWRGRHCATAAVYLCAFLMGAQQADAQYFGRNKVHYDRLDFRVLRTEHFDIYFYAEEADATRHAARMAERWYARYARLLDHQFEHRQPLVLYASHPHFAQTNLTADSPSEGTGGLTERNKSRIVMPFAAGLGETDHVLGHEIAHAFQIDIAKASRQNAFALPGWFIEGMAEYLSLGPVNVNTSMWLRDAALYDRLPTLDQLSDSRYFPYRYGHALWSYLTSKYGEGIVRQLLDAKTGDPIAAIEKATGTSKADLTREWHASISIDAMPRPRSVTRPHLVVSARNDDARLHMGPALSPDGQQLMFLSERDRLSLDLFLADASTGEVRRKILSTAVDAHFDSLQYIHSSGAWDADGQRFAMTAVSNGEAVLVVIDPERPSARSVVRLPGIGEAYTPSWSPDGTRIVFSGLKGGLSDLFVYTVATEAVTQLTADAFADLQPAWAPDGRTIALVTDRFTSSLRDLRFGAFRVGLLDLATGVVRPATEASPGAKQVNPQWSPDGQVLYFVSDRSGISNVYRLDLQAADVRQLTFVAGGVSGITGMSPALAVASRSGTLAFSVYRNGRYEIQSIRSDRAIGSVPPPLPEVAKEPGEAQLPQLLADSAFGLPDAADFTVSTYDDRLRLEAWSPPYIGAATGSEFGGLLRASVGFSLGDTLRDRQLETMFRAGTTRDDFAVQAAYTNRKGQWTWGVQTGFSPSRFVGARRSILKEVATTTRETTHLRYENQWASVTSRFDLDRSRRLEFRAGMRRTGYEWQTVGRVFDSADGRTISQSRTDVSGGRPVHLAEGQVAFVQDTTISGPTSPVLGQRLRLEIQPALGGLAYAGVLVDARRYLMPIRPVTLAIRLQHVGRYGPGANDPRLTPLLLGLQSLVRGYDIGSYAADECGRAATSCSVVDQLAGSRIGVANIELRAPLGGLLTGDIDYGRLPIEAIVFADAALLWTHQAGGAADRDQFRSVGAGARVNLGGIVLEMTAAKPFDSSRERWRANLLIRHGF